MTQATSTKRGGRRAFDRLSWLAVPVTVAALAVAGPARGAAPDKIHIAVVAFLSGPAAKAPGIPGRNAAVLIIDAINEGTMPKPFDSPGLGGVPIEPVFIDESGGASRQVTEFRNTFQRRNIDLFVGFISQADYKSIAPIAEELKVLTVFSTCGVPIFEDRDFTYVFQTISNSTAHSVGLARFIHQTYPDARKFAGINHNYAWGHNSWATFLASMKALQPDIVVVKEFWPKLFAAQYGAEISALLISRPDIIHSSLWAGDLEAFVVQGAPRGLFDRSRVAFSVGLHMLPVMGDRIPDGTIISSQGPYGLFMPKSETSDWFIAAYTERYGSEPGVGATHFAEAMFAVKAAYDAATDKAGRFPTTDEVIRAFEFIEWHGPSGKVRMAIGGGHQAILGAAVGYSKYDPELDRTGVTDVVHFDAECVNPPAAWKSLEWIEAGFPEAKCN